MTDALRIQLLAAARKLFLKFGYSKVTMDEIAREMGMSKKTVYLYFPSKLKLIEEVIGEIQMEIQKGVQKVLAEEESTILGKLWQVMVFVGDQLSQISPFVASDLERNVPELWQKLRDIKYDFTIKTMRNLIQEGIQQKKIKPDLEVEVLLLNYSCAVQFMRDPQFLHAFPKELKEKLPTTAEKLYEKWTELMLKGILA